MRTDATQKRASSTREILLGTPESNGAPRPSGAKVNILLVDDRPDKLLTYEALLSSLEQNLVRAHSGEEALRHLLKMEFAVVLLDVSMPGMDGFETAKLIRQRPRTQYTPIIFITSGDGSKDQVHQAYSLGAVDYIVAPIVPEVLQAKVSVFVDLRRQAEQIKHQVEQIRQIEEAGYRKLLAESEDRLEIEKKSEKAIRDLNSRLQSQVTALTEVNKELEAFNYSISHDLRAPLRSMQSFAQILLEDHGPQLGAEGADLAKRIAASSHYMDRLLADLLAYSRLTNAEMSGVAFSLDQTLKEVLTLLERDIQDKRAVLDVQPSLGYALGHSPTVVQILANLIANALKFVANGQTPRIRISSLRRDGVVRVSVQDNGIGIDGEHHGKIFGLFERLHSTKQYPGTGIGLALVRKGIERMGGRVGVESQLGKGSIFWVELPEVDEPASQVTI